MSLKFWDINVRMGASSTGTYKPAVNADIMITQMDKLGIEKSLVWHITQSEGPVVCGNRVVTQMIKNSSRLYGTWAALPPQAGEQEEKELFFKNMKQNRIRALRLFPGKHRFLLNRIVFGGFMDQIVERNIPVLFSIDSKDISWQELYGLLADYPKLVCIICDTGVWGTDRYFRPLVESYDNVYVETSLISLGDGVMEAFVRDYGPRRLLFGSGFPDRIPEAVMLQLLHADIAEDDKEAIAYGNTERLLREVRL